MYAETAEQLIQECLDSYKNRQQRSGREYRRLLRRREIYREYLDLIPADVVNLKSVRTFASSWDSCLYIMIPYNEALIKAVQGMLSVKGWYTDNSVEPLPESYLYYYHNSVDYWKIVLKVETPKRKSKSATCVLVPIEWETRVEAKTYDRICPDSHPQLFDENGEYIGDEVFPKPPDELA